MSYFLTEDQRLIQQAVDEFCKNPDTQAAMAADLATPGFPVNSWKALGEQGYISAYIPEEFGGMGMDHTTQLAIIEVLARYSYPALEALAAHHIAMSALNYWGTPAQKAKYLPGMSSGATVACAALNDPAGSFNFSEWTFGVEPDGDDFRITTTKVMVTNAHHADLKFMFSPRADGNGVGSAYIVHKGAEGLTTGHQEQRVVPIGGVDWGTIEVKDAKVASEDVLHDTGFGQLFLQTGFMEAGMMAVVAGEGAFQMALGYTSQRQNRGKPLAAKQAVAHRLVNMAIRSETSKQLCYTAARLWSDKRYEEAARLCSMAKIDGCEGASTNIHEATVLHGGLGYTPGAQIGVMNAMAVSWEIAETPPDVQRDVLARSLGIPID